VSEFVFQLSQFEQLMLNMYLGWH